MWFTVHPTPRCISVRRRHRVLVHRSPCRLAIKAVKALPHSLSHHRISMSGDHDVRIARVRPLGHPASLFVILQQYGDHAIYAFRRNQRQQAVLCAKRIPDGERRIARSLMHHIVVGTVITAVLRELARIEQRVVKRSVEPRLLRLRCARNPQPFELLLPSLPQPDAHAVELPIWNLAAQIFARLLRTEKRCSDTHHDGVFLELRIRSMLHGRTRGVAIDLTLCRRLFKLHSEITAEMRQGKRPEMAVHALRIIACNLSGRAIKSRMAIEPGACRIDQHATSRSLWKSKS